MSRFLGKTMQQLVPQNPISRLRQFTTWIQATDGLCSVKPELFGNFNKLRQNLGRTFSTTQWVLFKVKLNELNSFGDQNQLTGCTETLGISVLDKQSNKDSM